MAPAGDSSTFGIHAPGSSQGFYCPSCEIPLRYQWSRASDSEAGLSEFSDYYVCPAGCGTFEYERHRHRLRLASPGYAAGGATT